MQNAKLPIVIVSCDKYSDLWRRSIDHIEANWDVDRIQIYLVSNHLSFESKSVTMLKTGEDQDWSTNLLLALAKIDYEYALFWLDDCFFDKPVEVSRIGDLFNYCTNSKIDCLRLRVNPRPLRWNSLGFGEISKSAAYRTTLFCCIWRLESLKATLQRGESAWDFEITGSKRASHDLVIQCVRRDCFDFTHGVVKGKWIFWSAIKLGIRGQSVDLSNRERQTFIEWLQYLYSKIKSTIFHLIPEGTREKFLRQM